MAVRAPRGDPPRTRRARGRGGVPSAGAKRRGAGRVSAAINDAASLAIPDSAAVFGDTSAAAVACAAAAINVFGSILQQRLRARENLALEKEREAFEKERTAARNERRLDGLFERMRGPLLIAAVDLEERLSALAAGEVDPTERETTYTCFVLAQMLGYVEALRVDLPREPSFLRNVGGGGTTTSESDLMERGNALRLIGCGLAFLLGATDEVLARWLSEAPGGEGSSTDLVCTHPGRRNRALGAPERLNDDGKESGYLRLSQRDWSDAYAPAAAEVAAAVERAWDHPCDEEALAAVDAALHSQSGDNDEGSSDTLPLATTGRALLRIDPGTQRFVGEVLRPTFKGDDIVGGAFGCFVNNSNVTQWMKHVRADAHALAAAGGWDGTTPPQPQTIHMWSRVLLVQQLVVDLIELLDPTGLRAPLEQRRVLAATKYERLACWDRGASPV